MQWDCRVALRGQGRAKATARHMTYAWSLLSCQQPCLLIFILYIRTFYQNEAV